MQGIIGLAVAFNREVVAEGVETVARGTALLQLGSELAQGYGIARPMPPDQLPAWAATWQPDMVWGAVMNPGETSGPTDKKVAAMLECVTAELPTNQQKIKLRQPSLIRSFRPVSSFWPTI